MKKSFKHLTIFLVLILVFALCMLAACQPPKDPDPDEDENQEEVVDNALITNGSFATASNSTGSSYLKDVVKGWSKTSAATTYSNAQMGVVDLTADKFNAGKSVISESLKNPGVAPNTPKDENGNFKDSNAMIIALPSNKGSVFYKSSSSISIKQDTYYKISVDVATQIFDRENDLQGAWLYVTSGVYAEFVSIDTSNAWKTYEIYIEGNNYENRSVYIELWIGHGPKYLGSSIEENINPRLTKGAVFFDNVVMTEIEKSDYEAKVDALGENVTNGQVATASARFEDPNFRYESQYTFTSTYNSTTTINYYTAKSGSTAKYTQMIGTEDLEDRSEFPSYSSASSTAGIFDMSKFWTKDKDGKWIDTFHDKNNGDFNAPPREDFFDDEGNFRLTGARASDNSIDLESEALLIYHPDFVASGVGYKSRNTLLIEKDKYYKISVWAYVWVPEFALEEPEKPTEERPAAKPEPEDDNYDELLKIWEKWEKYDEELADYEALKEDYERRASNVFAHAKLTGVSVEEDSLVQKTDAIGAWQQLTFYIKGNELSDRQVYLEFWYGEGAWESEYLMVGGAMFDNVSIEVSDAALGGVEYDTLSALVDGDIERFGLMQSMAEDYVSLEGDDTWQFKFEDERTDPAAATVGIVNGSKTGADSPVFAAGGALAGLTPSDTLRVMYNDAKTPFNVVALYNKEYTATSLSYVIPEDAAPEDKLTVRANGFYRFSFWLRTEGLTADNGVTIALLSGDTTLTSLSKLNVENEWQEVVFYIKGSPDEAKDLSFKLTMGSGDVFTPASHLKGVAYLTAITFKEIKYTEFNAAKTGTYTASHSIASNVSTSNTVTNGYFANLDSSNFSDDTEELFDANGNLIGVAVPASWTVTSPVNNLATPKNLKIADGKLTWSKVDHATRYYVFIDEIEVSDPEDPVKTVKKENVLLAVIEGDGETAPATEWPITVSYRGKFTVRAFGIVDGLEVISSASSSVTNNYDPETPDNTIDESLVNPFEYDFGIVNYKNYDGIADKDNFYALPAGVTDDFYYKSTTSDNLLMVSSPNFYTRGGYTMSSSKSLSSNSYYMLSVWVKTEGDAKASITISNTSNVFARKTYDGEDYAVDGEYIGYVNQSTGGDWKQYRFYIKTNVSSASFKLELFLGNKYAVDEEIKYTEGEDGYDEDNPDKVKETIKKGLSKGTVYFDDIRFVTLTDEAEFNRLAYGAEDAEDFDLTLENKWAALNTIKNAEGKQTEFFSNQYIYKVLDYTTDSFDIYTASDTYGEQGNAAKDYTHGIVTDGVDYDEDAEEGPAMLYGIYNVDKLEDYLALLKDNSSFLSDLGDDVDATALQNFLGGNWAFGQNVLMMTNVEANGQSYTMSSGFSLAAGSYYKVTFYARAFLPSGKTAEFRFIHGDDSSKWETIEIADSRNANGMVEYTFYLYNEQESSISSNKIAFYLGTYENDEKDFFRGIVAIDNVSVVKLPDKTEYEAKVAEYNAMTDEQKAASTMKTYQFEKKESTDGEGDGDKDKDDGKGGGMNTQLWLLIASIVIGAILIAVIVVLTYRKVKKKLDKYAKKPKVESNVPADLKAKVDKQKQNKKKDNPVDDDSEL